MTLIERRKHRIERILARLEAVIDNDLRVSTFVQVDHCRLLLDCYSALEMLELQQLDGQPSEPGADA